MKIFAVRDEAESEQKDLAYLLYYEVEKKFHIELPDDADSWETPLLLSSFVKRGEKSVDAYWSKIWVQQRIIPTDRQNLGHILRDNGLKEYDEFDLLMLTKGRCAQDSYYLVPLTLEELPESIQKRFDRLVEDVIPLEQYSLLVFFSDGVVKKCHLYSYMKKIRELYILSQRDDFFSNVQVQTGGHGVTWDENRNISDEVLYSLGNDVPLTANDFKYFAMNRVVNVAEAAEILGCSRQNIDDLTKRGKLKPIKSSGKNTLYLKRDIVKRKWI